jgi:hypothetical protein
MANETTAPASAGALAVDPAKRYRVKLGRPVQIAPKIWARPSTHEVILLGSEIAQHGDAITSYEEV